MIVFENWFTKPNGEIIICTKVTRGDCKNQVSLENLTPVGYQIHGYEIQRTFNVDYLNVYYGKQ